MHADKDGCLKIQPQNFLAFPEAMAITTQFVLSHFDKDKVFFINVATDITEYCDCWGFTTGSILPDIGFLGSNDILAVDKASLDLLADKPLIRENVSRNLEIIEEAANQIPKEIREAYKEIPWSQIIGLRNRLIHGYFVVDYAIVWSIIKDELPDLKVQLEKVLKEEE